MNHRKIFVSVLLLLVVIVATEKTFSEGTSISNFRDMFSHETKKAIVIENIYNYKILHLIKPISLDVELSTTDNNSVISTITGIFLAMRNGDYEGYLQFFDEGSQRLLKEHHKKIGKDKKFWENSWINWLKNRVVTVGTWIETGDYVLLDYEAKLNDENITSNTIAFKNTDGKWYATMELNDDPVLVQWKTDKSRFSKIIR